MLRWRLCPGNGVWRGLRLVRWLNEYLLRSAYRQSRSGRGWESRYYFAKTPLPVLVIRVADAPATLVSSVELLS